MRAGFFWEEVADCAVLSHFLLPWIFFLRRIFNSLRKLSLILLKFLINVLLVILCCPLLWMVPRQLLLLE